MNSQHISGSIWTKNNPYGFKVNINHPEIAPLYAAFKFKKGYRWCDPISDADRLEFEADVIEQKKKRADDLKSPAHPEGLN